MRTSPGPNPFVQLLALLAFGALAILALAFSAFLFLLLLGAGLLLGVIGILRGSRLRWRVQRSPRAGGESRVIEGEYRRRDP